MKKILVVVDMQNDFIDGSLGTREAQDIVPYVAEKIRTAETEGAHIICTMDTHRRSYLQTREGKSLPVEHCIFGTNGWKLNEKILDALNSDFRRRMEFVVERGEEEFYDNCGNDFVLFRENGEKNRCSVIAKRQFGSRQICEEAVACIEGFSWRRPCMQIYEDDTELEFEVVGLCTDICVITNVLMLRTCFPEAGITVDSRGCAGVTKEKHQAALEVMRSCQVNVI